MDTSVNFTPLQWEFLSGMAAFEMPISLDVIAQLIPLSHTHSFDLLRKCEELGWIYQDQDGCFGLSHDLPDGVLLKIEKINSSAKLTKIVHTIKSSDLLDKIPEKAFQNLVTKSERAKLTLKNEMALAIESLKENKRDVAKDHVNKMDLLLSSMGEDSFETPHFIAEGFRVVEYCLGRNLGISTAIRIMEKIISLSEELGDERSWTMANILLGRICWHVNKLQEALHYLSIGKEKAEELGDQDILFNASCFIGLYYFIKGYLNKAGNYFEPVAQLSWKNEEYLLTFQAPDWLAYTYINRCDFQRAIGTLDFFRQLAIKRQDYFMVPFYRALLGIHLWVIRKKEEALFQLEGARADAEAVENRLAYWISLMGLFCLYFSEGEIDKGLPLFQECLQKISDTGVILQVFHPIYLESYFSAEQAGAKLPPEWRFDALFNKIMAEPNIDLRGVALRLRAVRAISEGKDEEHIFKDLRDSEALLEECEDLFQLMKTRMEIVRYYLRNDQQEKAANLAYDIYRRLTGYCEIFFPDDLKFLLEERKSFQTTPSDYGTSLEPIFRILKELFSRPNAMNNELLLATLSGFLRAERSAIFTFSHQEATPPELHMARNLSRSIISDHNFGRSMKAIMASYKNKKPLMPKFKRGNDGLWEYKDSLSVICLPLLKGTEVKAVFYFDNSYLSNCFDFIDVPMLESLGRHIAGFLEGREFETRDDDESHHSPHPCCSMATIPTDLSKMDIVFNDRKMLKLMNKIKLLSESEAPVLILGETGTGKEVVAQWVHFNSPRRSKPFVVVDLTTIPENLMDSELFGHERGAFTGAHHQKIGRVELAEGGTLFFDEIGEIPPHLQVKLLRLLEKKTFMRVGGTKNKHANFRLVAATNRDLPAEVKAGRFREDLYYRLNMLEQHIPPLRERKADISVLTSYFIEQYAKKYNKKIRPLTEEQEFSLTNYDWPGNVRELKSVIERAILVTEDGRVELDLANRPRALSDENPFSDFPTMDEIQRRYIQYVLDNASGKMSGPGSAAEILQMNRATLHFRMKKLGMR